MKEKKVAQPTRRAAPPTRGERRQYVGFWTTHRADLRRIAEKKRMSISLLVDEIVSRFVARSRARSAK